MDIIKYRQIIGSLLYLTVSRPNIMFDICFGAHFQVDPREVHLSIFHSRVKYIEIKHHLIRNHVQIGIVDL